MYSRRNSIGHAVNSLHNVQNKLTWHVDVVFDNIIHLDILFRRKTINTVLTMESAITRYVWMITDQNLDNQSTIHIHYSVRFTIIIKKI